MDSESHHGKERKNNLWMIVAIVFFLIIAAEGYYIIHKRAQTAVLMATITKDSQPKPTMGTRPKPMFVMKGQIFTDNPLYSKAHLIFPVTGTLSDDAQKALTGWDMKTTPNKDGSTEVDLIPKEANDIKQSFNVEKGYKLYFIEMTLVDDQTGVDENRGDDIGVLVDQKGVVQ